MVTRFALEHFITRARKRCGFELPSGAAEGHLLRAVRGTVDHLELVVMVAGVLRLEAQYKIAVHKTQFLELPLSIYNSKVLYHFT